MTVTIQKMARHRQAGDRGSGAEIAALVGKAAAPKPVLDRTARILGGLK